MHLVELHANLAFLLLFRLQHNSGDSMAPGGTTQTHLVPTQYFLCSLKQATDLHHGAFQADLEQMTAPSYLGASSLTLVELFGEKAEETVSSWQEWSLAASFNYYDGHGPRV